MSAPTPEEIRKLRQLAGLTQRQAAEVIGLTDERSWRAYEMGEYKIRPLSWAAFVKHVRDACGVR